jgi:quercetin dioxygenase-like cupin family protein
MYTTYRFKLNSHRRFNLLSLAILAGFACSFGVAKAIPIAMDAAKGFAGPICSVSASGSPLDRVDVVDSYPLANVPGKRVTVVRVFYGPGGFSMPHRHSGTVTAYITKGRIMSQLNDGPTQEFTVGQTFVEPPGTRHMVSANASNSEEAELIAIFVADEGAQLTTPL